MDNVLLTNHHTVLVDIVITKPVGERTEITNPYTTKISLYNLKKLSDQGWRNITRHLLEKDWGNIAKASVEELQDLIANTYEEGVMKYAELKKPHDPNRKNKPPRDIVKYLCI